MSERALRRTIVISLAAALLLVVGATLLGLWLGRRSARTSRPPTFAADLADELGLPANAALEEPPTPPVAEPPNAPPQEPPAEPPLFLYASMGREADEDSLVNEAILAAKAGIHRYVLPAALSWEGEAPTADAGLGWVQSVINRDPEAQFLLYLDLNPPKAWLETHREAALTDTSGDVVLPSVAAPAWQSAARQAMDRLVEAVAASGYEDAILGYVLAGLKDGQWRVPQQYRATDACTAAFRAWLARRYGEEEALQTAWNDSDVRFKTAKPPKELTRTDTANVFFLVPRQQAHIDFLEFLSSAAGDAVLAMAAHMKQAAGDEAVVLVPYGYSFGLVENNSGHLALGKLLDGPVDGFVSPVSSTGDAGGFMGPIDSVLRHGKQWFLIDNTCADAAGPDARRGHRRNFAPAVAAGLGLFWEDPGTTDELLDEDTWARFARMREGYQTVHTAGLPKADNDRLLGPYPAAQFETPALAVVVDETSRFYQRCDVPLNRELLAGMCDAALRAGVSVQFYLLDDVLDGTARASVYLFLNAFRLTTTQRERLRTVLDESDAAAIWMYAPGYISEDGASADNVSAAVGMHVKAFGEPEVAGSVCELSGRWVQKDEEFGGRVKRKPLFYVDEEDANVIARYKDSQKTSVAIKFFDSGWTSVFVGEPTLPPQLLKELLRLLGQHIHLRKTPDKGADHTYFGPRVLALSADEPGERVLDLGGLYEITDLLEPHAGWPRNQFITLALRSGETRTFLLTPLEPADNGAANEAPPAAPGR